VVGHNPATNSYYSIGIGGYGYAYVIDEYLQDRGWRAIAGAGRASEVQLGTAHDIGVLVDGQRATLTVDGVRVLERTLPAPLFGDQVGLFAWGTKGVHFDAFTIEPVLPAVQPPVAPQSAPAEMFGRWQLTGIRLGTGGQGAVEKVFDPKTNEDGALKRRSGTRALSDKGQERFLREVTAMRAIEHTFVVKIIEAGLEPEPYLVTRIARHGSLHDCREAFAGDVWRCLRLARSIALGLKAAHERNVVHRDVKPRNVISHGVLDRLYWSRSHLLARRLGGDGDRFLRERVDARALLGRRFFHDDKLGEPGKNERSRLLQLLELTGEMDEPSQPSYLGVL
jgi:hypothetical protein